MQRREEIVIDERKSGTRRSCVAVQRLGRREWSTRRESISVTICATKTPASAATTISAEAPANKSASASTECASDRVLSRRRCRRGEREGRRRCDRIGDHRCDASRIAVGIRIENRAVLLVVVGAVALRALDELGGERVGAKPRSPGATQRNGEGEVGRQDVPTEGVIVF
jgi:hypothetical protein